MEKTLHEVLSLAKETVVFVTSATASNENVNRSLIKLLVISNLIWAIVLMSTVFIYFTADYEYYGEVNTYNENINRNVNE